MRVNTLHSWNLSPQDARQLQERLARKVSLKNKRSHPPRIIAGCDISCHPFSKTGYAGIVLLDAKTLNTTEEFSLQGELTFPYVPGLLSFREGPLLLDLFERMKTVPDLIFFDGQGLAHPRRLGLACHLGLFLDTPTIGLAKTPLIGNFEEPGMERGAHSPLLDDEGTPLGTALRTRTGCKPVFVSPGHHIDIPTALDWALKVTGKYRIPEPTRLAHNLVNRVRKAETG